TRQLRIESSQGEPRESPRLCEKKAGDEAVRLNNASACGVRDRRSTNPTTGTQTQVATGRGRAARSANADGQSADGIVDEKSVGKIPPRAGPSKAETVPNPSG
ncbi:MAG: hypothetical protein AAB403_23030, partial [Planctomycetota bacterium]